MDPFWNYLLHIHNLTSARVILTPARPGVQFTCRLVTFILVLYYANILL